MNCRRAIRFLCLHADGSFGSRRKRAIADHVASCLACRLYRDDLAAALEAARSVEMPVQEIEAAELRRSVWRQIQSERDRATRRSAAWSFWSIGSVAAATAGGAAILVSLHLFARRPTLESTRVSESPAPPEIVSAPVASSPLPSSAPIKLAAESRLGSSPVSRADAGKDGVTRIEFRTSDPQVRIIWLVGKQAPEDSSTPLPGPKQEVS